ncbi:acyltransferase-domain-containing protein [Pisolithus albus]|nr:acyltransferase-domain-containing protein [Pisolithus albus]
MTTPSSPYQLPIHARPRRSCSQWLNALVFLPAFLFGCLMIHSFQLLFLLPLKLVPMRWSSKLYDEGIRYTKGCFALLISQSSTSYLMNEWFAPTSLSITFETQDKGKFTLEEIQQIVQRDATGKVVALNLPPKLVIISNHQVYCDWWYVWCLTYFMQAHKDVFIVLKKSLKWIPVLGTGMQMFRFIFLSRSWVADKVQLTTLLSKLGKKAEEEDKPFVYILFPEGTLVSKNTRPISRSYAGMLGIPDLHNVLLPRSMGLFCSLRSLSPRLPTLKLLDVTIVYPGVPPRGYGQSYYTLRSIFCDRVPPPVVHMHLRIFDVAKEVPIGDVPKCKPTNMANGRGASSLVETEVPEGERIRFDEWLRELWTCKDRYITRFLDGDASVAQSSVLVPLKLQDKVQVASAYCYFAPAVVAYAWSKLVKKLF